MFELDSKTAFKMLERYARFVFPLKVIDEGDNGKEYNIPIDLCIEKVRQALKILDVFKREIFIDTSAQHTFFGGKELIFIKESEHENGDMVSMLVSEEERQLIKEWLENANR